MAARQKHEEYIETAEFPGNTHLEVSVRYSLGGMNYFSGRNEGRGFYLSVMPVKKERGMISTVLFSGIKMLIHPANRFSEKQLKLAVEMSKPHVQTLIDNLKAQQKCA